MSVSGRQKGSGWSLRAWQPNCSSSRPGTKWDLSLASHSLAYAETFSMPEILSSRLSAQQGPPHPSGFSSNVSSQERPTLTSFCPNCVYCFKKKKKAEQRMRNRQEQPAGHPEWEPYPINAYLTGLNLTLGLPFSFLPYKIFESHLVHCSNQLWFSAASNRFQSTGKETEGNWRNNRKKNNKVGKGIWNVL